jgi:predicted glycoside hydrolase/deacetylase ChbG (UPF0249 family)
MPLSINKKNIIVSADDFGKSELANKNILKLAELGKLDRVSIMVNGKFSEDELKKIVVADVKLDVHLDVEERLEDKEQIQEGFIKRSFIFWNNYLFGTLKKNSIEKKWDSQINKFIDIVGREPDGINTHRYDHFFPSYFPKALKLAKKYKISRIRFGQIIPVEKNGLTSAILKYFYRKNEEAFRKSGLSTFDYCVSLDWIENMENFLEKLPEGEIELVCHPEREGEKNIINKYF